MLQKVKKSLRIINDQFDDEMQDLIDSALLDLKLSGVTRQLPEDKLILRAVTLYCKAQFGLENKDSEKYQASYEYLKSHLALSGEYNGNV